MQTKKVLVFTRNRLSVDRMRSRFRGNTLSYHFFTLQKCCLTKALKLLKLRHWNGFVIDSVYLNDTAHKLLETTQNHANVILSKRYASEITEAPLSSHHKNHKPRFCYPLTPNNQEKPKTNSKLILDNMQARYAALVENIPGVVFQLKETPLDTTYTFVSDGCQALFGETPDHFIGTSIKSLALHMLPAHQESFLKAFEHSSSNMRAINWEGAIILNKNKEIKWINIRACPRLNVDNDILWEGTMLNITDVKLAMQKLAHQRLQLSELSNHLQGAKEEERERIAQDVHDAIGSALVGARMQIALLAQELLDINPSLHHKAQEIDLTIAEAISITGRVARELKPGILKEFGLTAAIECLLEDFQKKSGLSANFDAHGEDPPQEGNVALTVFRIAQECLANVCKHAKASHVIVILKNSNNEIFLSIADDGKGLLKSDLKKQKSFGIRCIQERVEALGGKLIISTTSESQPSGMQVSVTIPLLSKILNKSASKKSTSKRTTLELTKQKHLLESHLS